MTPGSTRDALTAWATAQAWRTGVLHHVLLLAGILTVVMIILALAVIHYARADAEAADRFRRNWNHDGRTARLMSRWLTAAVVAATATVVVSTSLAAVPGTISADHAARTAGTTAATELTGTYDVRSVAPARLNRCADLCTNAERCPTTDWDDPGILAELDTVRTDHHAGRPAVLVTTTNGHRYIYEMGFDAAGNLTLRPRLDGQPDPRTLLRPATAIPNGNA